MALHQKTNPSKEFYSEKKIFSLQLVIIAAVLVFFILNIYTEYVQIREIGPNFLSMFWIDFNSRLAAGIAIFVVAFIVSAANLMTVRNIFLKIDVFFEFLRKKIIVFAFSVLFSGFFAFLFKNQLSHQFLVFLNSEWFSLGDPVFYNDVGYYMFQRPFFITLINIAVAFSLFMIFLNLMLYFFIYARFDFYSVREIFKNKSVILHLFLNFIIYLLAKTASYKFLAEEILFSDAKEFAGAGYTDIKVWLIYYRLIPYVLFAVITVSIILFLKSKFKYSVAVILIYPALYAVTFVLAAVTQSFYVIPNGSVVEQPYIKNNISFTRYAYDIEKMSEKTYSADNTVTEQDILANKAAIDNIAAIDFGQTLKAVNRLQGIKPYYSFFDSDIVTYGSGSEKVAVFSSAREPNHENLDRSVKNYVNMNMKYTHGMGIAVNLISSTTEDGLPSFIVKDIPPKSFDFIPDISEPRIYYGESINKNAVVATKDGEYDDLTDGGYSYNGSGGIPLNIFNRIIFAVKNSDWNMLLSRQIQWQSKLLVNRNVMERVRTVAPFLMVDSDPYIFINENGGLTWVVDAYTVSDKFPYSRKTGEYNYIRNSVKAAVDAYSGEVKLYICDYSDPVIKVYDKIYPSLFEQDEMPADLKEKLKYPEYLFKTQADIIKRYSVTSVKEFYQKTGALSFSKEKYENDKVRDVAPYYVMMKQEGDLSAELTLMVPYSPANKDNISAFLTVKCSGNGYGDITLYRIPESEKVYGTYQMESRIDTDPEISREFSLWNAGGSSVIRGAISVIPIAGSFLYVEPIYISSGSDSALPAVKSVVVACGDEIVMESSVDKALERLFGVKVDPFMQLSAQESINNTVDSYNKLKEIFSSGNWIELGEAMRQLENSIKNLSNYAASQTQADAPQE